MFYMNKPFNLLMISTLMMSTLMALSSSNWLFLWMAMEINLLSFIPIIMNTKSSQETEAAIKYFMAQALGSSLMLMSSTTLWMSNSFPSNMSTILIFSILLKLGMVPMHFWFPSVMTSISWMAALILATWQKLAPLLILSFILETQSSNLFIFIASMNAILGGMMGMNQSHIRTIMAYSSITHMGWMSSMLSIYKPMSTFLYYVMYCIVIAPLFITLHYKAMINANQFNKLFMNSSSMNILIPLMLLSLGGMPPLTGFAPKWLTIASLSTTNPMLLMLLILGSMMNMYFYLNILFSSMLVTNMKFITKLNFNTYLKPSMIMISFIMLMPIMFMI